MARNETTSAIIDGILKISVSVGTVSLAIITPNIMKVLDAPTQKFLNSLDKRSQERELRRVMNYVLREKLITEHYQHGIVLSKSAKKRLEKREFNSLSIERPEKWDKHWRLVIFDIPEEKHIERASFTGKIKQLGFQHLQQSVWVHPFPCKEVVARIVTEYSIEKYVTYIETSHIDNDHLLKKRFENVLK